jgi:hypothetical protein
MKGDIERFYGDKFFEPIYKLLSFSSHDKLLRKIHDYTLWHPTQDIEDI